MASDTTNRDDRAVRRNRRQRTEKLRALNATRQTRAHPFVEHPTRVEGNGDSGEYYKRFSKGLPHDRFGEVVPDAYERLTAAVETGGGGDFAAIPESPTFESEWYEGLSDEKQPDPATAPDEPDGGRVLVNPEASITFTVYGLDSNDVWAPANPPFGSDVTGAEMIELYWMALLRDVRFDRYNTDDLAQQAASEVEEAFTDAYDATTEVHESLEYRGPRASNGAADPSRLFRGDLPGVDRGPYLSQFLIKDFTRGSRKKDNQQQNFPAGENYLTDYESWLGVQNGKRDVEKPDNESEELTRRHILTGRDLATFVRFNNSPQQFLNAAFYLQGDIKDDFDELKCETGVDLSEERASGPPLDDGVPVESGVLDDGFVDYGRSEYQAVVAGIHNTHLRAAWYHKWRVHRRLRPEEYGGRVYHVRNGNEVDGEPAGERYSVPANLLDSEALAEHEREVGTSLLSQAYGLGSPTHPSYPAGHGVSAGALATLLKAFFDEDQRIPAQQPVPKDEDEGAPVDEVETELEYVEDEFEGALTIETEANKLAANTHLGRNFAGIHYRSDGVAGTRIGERVAVSYLTDLLATKPADAYDERASFTFTTFDGTEVEVTATNVRPTDPDENVQAFDPPLYI